MKKIKVTMYFSAGDITKPITYHLIKDYNLQINILHADIGLNKIGKLTVDIIGEESDIDAGLKFVEEQGVRYELCVKACPLKVMCVNR